MNFRAARVVRSSPWSRAYPQTFLSLSLFYRSLYPARRTAHVLLVRDSGGRISQRKQEAEKARGTVVRLGRQARARGGGEREERGRETERREGDLLRGRKRAGRASRQAPHGSRVGPPGGRLAALQSLSGRGRGAGEWRGTPALNHWLAAGKPSGHWAT